MAKKIIRIALWLVCVVGVAHVGAQTVFVESGGVVVMDVKSTPVATGWMEDARVAGYLGDSYYVATDGTSKRDANFMDGMMECR